MKRFEYKAAVIETNKMISHLNMHGMEGWEVVSIKWDPRGPRENIVWMKRIKE